LRIAPFAKAQAFADCSIGQDFGGTRLKVTPWLQAM
jgi:hypothetical protein